jgi:dihydroorotase
VSDTDIEKVICGRAFFNGELQYTEIGISDGKIVAAGRMVRGGDERVDVGTSKVILPGFMDPHVHLRDPGMTSKEDFSTGTLAAIHAGVTCILDMPNTKPPVTDLDTLMDKKRTVSRRAYTDYGLFAAVTPDINAGMLAPLVPGFKLFMGSTTGNILLNDDEELIPAVSNALSTGKRVSVHAEDDSMMLHETERCTRDHLRNRPAEAEWNAITRLARSFRGQRINICHLTTPQGLDLAKEAGFTTEITMHHMTFDVDRNTGAMFKVNPPIRTAECRDAMRERFLRGDIEMIGTDHAPHTVDEKSRDFDSAPGGMPGVETAMPMVMDMVRRGEVPMKLAVGMGAENPCRAFSVNKGRIAEGCDADLAIFDLRNSCSIDVKRLHSKCGHSEYAGMAAVFPETVMVRGEIQVEDWEFCGDTIGEDICGRGRLF